MTWREWASSSTGSRATEPRDATAPQRRESAARANLIGINDPVANPLYSSIMAINAGVV